MSVQELFHPAMIRKRCQALFSRCEKGEGDFLYHPERWDDVVTFVDEVISENYPTMNIPFHSRLNHFRPGGVDRLEWLAADLKKLSPLEQVKTLFDLVIPSVLLDAGAGERWTYFEEQTQQIFGRSEGLGVASFHLFFSQQLSAKQGLKTTTDALQGLTLKQLEQAFQVKEDNPIIGMAGRLSLLQKLGSTLKDRPGELAELMIKDNKVSALQVLAIVLEKLGPIWPSRHSLDGVALGDCWPHPALAKSGSFESFVPFHKLSQWMSYSLLDCFKWAGFELTDLDQLTGLPEYRNGGLFLDLGLISLREPAQKDIPQAVDTPLIIEWRALTVCLLDELAWRLQKKRQLSAEQFPLACVLEGGSWWAGRKIAKLKRPNSAPPLNLILDGTVF
jgi:hypothetical protein